MCLPGTVRDSEQQSAKTYFGMTEASIWYLSEAKVQVDSRQDCYRKVLLLNVIEKVASNRDLLCCQDLTFFRFLPFAAGNHHRANERCDVHRRSD